LNDRKGKYVMNLVLLTDTFLLKISNHHKTKQLTER